MNLPRRPSCLKGRYVQKPSWVYGALSLHGVRHSCSAAGNTCEELWRSTCRFSPELPAVALFACRSHSVAFLSVRSSAVHVPDTTTVWSRLLDWREEVARKLLPVQWPQSSLAQKGFVPEYFEGGTIEGFLQRCGKSRRCLFHWRRSRLLEVN